MCSTLLLLHPAIIDVSWEEVVFGNLIYEALLLGPIHGSFLVVITYVKSTSTGIVLQPEMALDNLFPHRLHVSRVLLKHQFFVAHSPAEFALS